MPCFATSSSGRSSSTPASRAIVSSCSSAGPIVPGLPCVITAARRTAFASAGRGCDPVVDVVEELRLVTLDEMEEDLTVPFRARQAGVYDADRLPSPRERCLDDLADDAPPNGDVSDDSLRRLPPHRLELRLDEDDRLPLRRSQREYRRERLADADERDVADDELWDE